MIHLRQQLPGLLCLIHGAPIPGGKFQVVPGAFPFSGCQADPAQLKADSDSLERMGSPGQLAVQKLPQALDVPILLHLAGIQDIQAGEDGFGKG